MKYQLPKQKSSIMPTSAMFFVYSAIVMMAIGIVTSVVGLGYGLAYLALLLAD